MTAEVFFDTNILLYMLSEDIAKADCAEKLVSAGGVISVQVLNEFTNVARRKGKLSWKEIDEFFCAVTYTCSVHPLTLDVHQQGRKLAQRYGFSVYDAIVVSSAYCAGCKILYTEDMQDGMEIEGILTIQNPFK